MAGLTREGFIAETLDDIKRRIESRITDFNPGFDLDPESPDGQLIGIFTAELKLVWDELLKVSNSYNPNSAQGQSLRNLGQLSGVSLPTATRSHTILELHGVVGTVVPEGSFVSTLKGYVFYTSAEVTIQANGIALVSVLASKLGPVPVDAGSIVIVDSVVVGWDSVLHTDTSGVVGDYAMNDIAYRNLRNRTVMRNTSSLEESLQGRLAEIGIGQVLIRSNDTANDMIINSAIDPVNLLANSILITVSDTTATNQEIVDQIYKYKGLGVQTSGVHYNDEFGNPIYAQDSIGFNHIVKFKRADPVPVFIDLVVTFHTVEVAGALESIKDELIAHVNNLEVGEDVIWSRLFGLITPYAEAEVNTLEIGEDVNALIPSNISIDSISYARLALENINITVSP